MVVPHSGSVSRLTHSTAKTAAGGRGLSNTALMMSEAAYYPNEDSWVSLMNTMSGDDPENVVIVETTPNGMDGPGETYYNYWNSAVDGVNQFMPIFLPWHDDPETLLPDHMAEDAPRDEYEKWLMDEIGVTRGQIAWFRRTLEDKCAGSIYKWRAEYSASPVEAFVSTGESIFDFFELEKARKDCEKGKPVWEGKIDWYGDLLEEKDGPLVIYEQPRRGDHYFIGVDAAKGTESGDFAAGVCWNAETGTVAFKYADRCGPEQLARRINHLGQRYNKAMINVELTGGWGYTTMKELRDIHYYPNQYRDRGRDDRVTPKGKDVYGWETTWRSRQMLFDVFRTDLRRGDLHVNDQELMSQMSKAQIDRSGRWIIRKGHDDVIMAAMLGWIALFQYHTPHILRPAASTLDKLEGNERPVQWKDSPETTVDGCVVFTGAQHLKKLEIYDRKKTKVDRLLGL
jgi:hypothetical protein